MEFSRTPSGLSNMALFCGADFVVFTEGGSTSYNINDVINGNFNTNSVDIKFWDIALRKYGFNRSLHFRALGSKTCAEEIAIKVANSEISNVIVVRDSDLDVFLGLKIESPFVLYTYGYSWENDVWQKKSVQSQVEKLNTSTSLTQDCLNSLHDSFSVIDKYAKRLLQVELIYRRNGVKFITTCTGEQFVNNRSQPNVKMKEVLKLLRKSEGGIARPAYTGVNFNLKEATRFFYGKLYECLAYNVLCFVCKSHFGIKSIPKSLITPIMIDAFSDLDDHDINEYYINMISNLDKAI